jgi:nitroimidazol reductase NimA-like FMN-containing flavoprotein (pyridoxamine 5'-phosphate oxidase superfamily)
MKFMSVIGFGKASMVEDEERKIKALNIIMRQCFGTESNDYTNEHLGRVAIVRIKLETLVGKVLGYDQA